MKNRPSLVLGLIAFAAMTPASFAAQKSASPPVSLTHNGRLNAPLTPMQNEISIYVTDTGRLISPPPIDSATNQPTLDLEKVAKHEATQVWINDNLDHLNAVVGRFAAEARTAKASDVTGYINTALQAHLAQIGAGREIDRINATMIHQLATPAPSPVSTVGNNPTNASLVGNVGKGQEIDPNKYAQLNGSCGPRGTCLTVVEICITDPTGTSCSVIDCDTGCRGCCGYGLKMAAVDPPAAF